MIKRNKIEKLIWYIIIVALAVLIPHSSNASVAVIGGLTQEKTVKSGEIYQGIITLANYDEEPQEANIYQTDYAFFSDGKTVYGEPGGLARSNAKWITFSPNHPTIPPKGTLEVTYTIKVPLSKELKGTYWSVIMVEGIPKLSSENGETEKDKVKFGVKTVICYGIQMITNIGDTGLSKLKFLGTQLIKNDSGRILQVDVENVGERLLRPTLWCEVYDQKGILISRLEGGSLRTYPGTSIRYNARVIIKRPRFSINKQQLDTFDFSETLDKGRLPDFLLKSFKERLISISDKAVIQIEESGNKWIIINDDGEYSVVRSENGLDIYQNSNIPSGTYKALIIADCGNDFVFGAKYDLKISE